MTTVVRLRRARRLVPALAVMLGANVGTTLIVQVLSFDVAAVAPALFMIGADRLPQRARSRARDIGRVAIGLGLMLLSLHILLDTLAPFEDAPSVRCVRAPSPASPCSASCSPRSSTWAGAFQRRHACC